MHCFDFQPWQPLYIHPSIHTNGYNCMHLNDGKWCPSLFFKGRPLKFRIPSLLINRLAEFALRGKHQIKEGRQIPEIEVSSKPGKSAFEA